MTLPACYTTDQAAAARPLHLLARGGLEAWLAAQPRATVEWLAAQHYTGAPGALALLPGEGGLGGAVLGVDDALDPLAYGGLAFGLPAGGAWTPATAPAADVQRALQLGWGLGAYRFTRYKAASRAPAQLRLAQVDAETLDVLAAITRVRDWVNTPTEDMGPQQLEEVARELAGEHGAQIVVSTGDALLADNHPTIHAVGRASHRPPRLIELTWGDPAHPHVAIVGKGVCFDTGGLDLKPADGMRNMKKDMGGAAHALALAGLVMARRLPLRISLLVPAVENAIGPDALRPGEVVRTRAGTTVEIDNTDAEGRLILCDALTRAGELAPACVLDFATLTGAARVALGPELPVLFANDDALADDWIAAGQRVRDPLWRLPLWRPYLRYLTSSVADLANAGGRMAGAITAALYLERFVPAGLPWAHLDVYAWNDSERPGRPTGGEAMALRAAFEMLKARAG
ncbi:MAG: leucyl aminopeptidase family protein [Pseudoxanthomonas sp.]